MTKLAPPPEPTLSEMERQGLTIWGNAISAQIRDYGRDGEERVLVLHVRDDAPRSPEDYSPVLVPASDIAKLRDLLNEAAMR